MRVENHPILGKRRKRKKIIIEYDGKNLEVEEGEPIAAALMANGIISFRYTTKKNEPRGLFCAIGRCSDCFMIVDGIPNTRTCVTPIKEGMRIQTQHGVGKWRVKT